MATSIESILKHLPRLFPEIKVSPLPEDIFLATIKLLLVPAASLSLAQWGILGSLILLTNASPALRSATAKLYGYLSLLIGAEIAMINAYVLICSWISPSTTLRPVTVVTLNVLNSVVPVFTDSLVLARLIKEKVSHSHSGVNLNLVSTIGTPILLKCMRLAGAVMSIHASTEFIITSLTVEKGGAAPDISIVETARKWSVYMSSGLHLIDNAYSFWMHWTHTIKMRELGVLSSPLVATNLSSLVLSFGSQYVLPIVLSTAHLAASTYLPSGETAMLIDSAKVVINIASAGLTTLRKSGADAPPGLSVAAALLKKAEDVGMTQHDVLEKISVSPVATSHDASGASAPADKVTSMVPPATMDLMDGGAQLNLRHHLSPESSLGSP